MNPSLATLTPPATPTLGGRRGLVIGVANEHSIAWGCAAALAQHGASLVLSCFNEKAMQGVMPLAQGLNNSPVLCCNVEEPGALARLVDAAVQTLGGLDFVVHSIAWAPLDDLHGRVADVSAEGFARAIQVSCHSLLALAHFAEPHLKAAGGGTLVTMSYLGAEGVVPHYGLMGPVKAALESSVRYLAAELGPQQIRVHAVSPGPIATRAASGLAQFDELLQRAATTAPLGRLVTIDEVGQLVAFLVGPGGTGMTGQTLFVDGGAHALR